MSETYLGGALTAKARRGTACRVGMEPPEAPRELETLLTPLREGFNMAGTAIKVSDLFNKAQELAEERAATLEAQAANREILRNLNLSGMLSEDEAELLEQYYPTRTRVRGEGEPEDAE